MMSWLSMVAHACTWEDETRRLPQVKATTHIVKACLIPTQREKQKNLLNLNLQVGLGGAGL